MTGQVAGELGQRQGPVGLVDLADLGPRRLHQGFLVLDHHSGAQPGDHPVAGRG